ncbi:MAG TPA: glycosyltransferase family 4 protein [Acidimicrobiales bacterium]|nr:glycosyltransferase family 4 protein [Acidimicrobiales bacterium]
MRALLVAHNTPWPPLGGGLVRLAQVVEAVASVAELDLFVLHDLRRSKVVVPPTVPVTRWEGAQYPRTSPQLRWRLDWAIRRGVPWEVAMARADRNPRLALRDWARPPYEAVWFSTAAAFAWMGRPDFGPTIVDLMDLDDVKARLRARLLTEQLRSGLLTEQLRSGAQGGLARTGLAWCQARLNGSDWRRFQRSVSAQVERVVVPSEMDATRSRLTNVEVVPNTYPRPTRPAGNPTVSGIPVVLFQGTLGYPPNIDGAQWLTGAIAPRVRTAVPACEMRLVGRPATSVKLLHQPPMVTVVGQVPSMEVELARATVAVVPVRYGSGTRVKILECFAHRVPVVSTTVGAEGLDVVDGVHLLIADDPDEFATATVRLLGDARLRVRLTEAAERLYLDRYDGRVADEGVRRLLAEVAGLSTRS